MKVVQHHRLFSQSLLRCRRQQSMKYPAHVQAFRCLLHSARNLTVQQWGELETVKLSILLKRSVTILKLATVVVPVARVSRELAHAPCVGQKVGFRYDGSGSFKQQVYADFPRGHAIGPNDAFVDFSQAIVVTEVRRAWIRINYFVAVKFGTAEGTPVWSNVGCNRQTWMWYGRCISLAANISYAPPSINRKCECHESVHKSSTPEIEISPACTGCPTSKLAIITLGFVDSLLDASITKAGNTSFDAITRHSAYQARRHRERSSITNKFMSPEF